MRGFIFVAASLCNLLVFIIGAVYAVTYPVDWKIYVYLAAQLCGCFFFAYLAYRRKFPKREDSSND